MSAFLVLDATGAAINRVLADAIGDVVVAAAQTVVADDGRQLVAARDAPRVPASVTNFQCRAVLMGMPSPSGTVGRTLFQDVDDMLKARGGLSWQAWEFANQVDRHGPLVMSLIATLGMSGAQADALFITASGISA